MSDDIAGTDWSDTAIDLIVADYFDMLKIELGGQSYNKAERNRALQEMIHRSHGSIERKHQNISAVLVRLGLRWIKGYKPLPNFQGALLDGVGRMLAGGGKWLLGYAEGVPSPEPAPAFSLGAPPEPSAEVENDSRPYRRLVRKYDPAKRDAQNRDLGMRGEEFVFHFERDRLLNAGRKDLAHKLEWTSQERGDGAGYDIHSFDLDGKDRLIEVKTTNGGARTPFYLSENERAFSEERPAAFKLLRLHDFRDTPGGFELVPPLSKWVRLKPTVYRASF